DIVDVDQYAGLQFWQNLQVKSYHIATDGYDVAGIDKKNVSAFQAVEEFEINVLDGIWNLLYPAITAEPLREGINRNQLGLKIIPFAVFLDGGGKQTCAVSGSYFNHPRGFEVTHHAICNIGIDSFEVAVVVVIKTILCIGGKTALTAISGGEFPAKIPLST